MTVPVNEQVEIINRIGSQIDRVRERAEAMDRLVRAGEFTICEETLSAAEATADCLTKLQLAFRDLAIDMLALESKEGKTKAAGEGG